ncbi:MAG TPA: hypothetical protein ENK13_03905, partial [Thermopetrobacter sp.]|nr:hypothetical protein [Thermopetrobacter sp.]
MDDNGGGSAQNGGGKPADDGRRLATVVTYLEMRGPSHAFVPPPANLRMTLMKAEKPTVHYYR